MKPLGPAMAAAAAATLCSCALLSKGERVTPLYFTPASTSAGATQTEQAPLGSRGQLRLGRVTSSAYLRERMVYRDRSGRVGYYEERRWTERPEAYLRRALSRALFEERGFKRTVAGAGVSLDVELVAFEELQGPNPVVRLEAVALLEDGRASIFEHTVVVERPIGAAAETERDNAAVLAFSAALEAAVAQIAERVASALPSPSAPDAQPEGGASAAQP